VTSTTTGARSRADRARERRLAALLATFRQLRHDLASPLSGSGLHLEMASRRLAQRTEPELVKVAENVRVSQHEIAWASALLDVMGELARSSDDAIVPFSMAECLRKGAARQSPRAARDGNRLDLPQAGPDVTLFGAPERFEQAVSDLTARALAEAGRGAPVAWSLEPRDSGVDALLAWPSTGSERSERAFALVRRRAGEPLDAALFLARWVVEGLGGTLVLERDGSLARARASFEREGEE
jgi:hypothetical protein